MNEHDESRDYAPDDDGADDVEIIEVVGVDEDIPAPSAALDDDIADSDDVVLTLEGDSEPEDEGGAASDDPREREGEEAPALEPSAVETELVHRLRADYDNLRKRVARERELFEEQANSSLIEGLLPVLDNFDRALSVQIRSSADGAFRAGMVMIYEQFAAALQKEGLRRIESVGRTFDPSLHDAVATDRDSDLPPNTIIEEMQRGYLFRERVLRPAMVKVSTNGTQHGATEPTGGEL